MKKLIGLIIYVMAFAGILYWYDWKLLVILVIWQTAVNFENKNSK